MTEDAPSSDQDRADDPEPALEDIGDPAERAELARLVGQLDALRDGPPDRDAPGLAGLLRELRRRWWWPGRQRTPARPVVQLQTLGPLVVQVGGRRVRLPFARCGELLAWLALHGPAPREHIVDALWDGLATASQQAYFKVVVRRTRAALAQQGGLDFNPLPFEGGVYRLSARLEVRADVLDLARAAEHGELEAMRAVLLAYHGEFLSGSRGEWVELTRRHALDDAVTVALMLGAKLEASAPREALAAYRRAASLDPYNDDAHQGVIRLLRALGQEGSANVARRSRQRDLEDVEPGAGPPDDAP